MERFRPVIMGARLILLDGIVERLDREHAPRPLFPVSGDPGPAVPIIHIVVRRLVDASADLERLSDDFTPVPIARADEVRRPTPGSWRGQGHPRDVHVLPKSRDFH
jgi:error-prone DNA polymerase